MKPLAHLIALLSLGGDTSGVSAPKEIPWQALVVVQCAKAVGSAFHIGNGRYVTADHVLANGGGSCAINGEPIRVLHESPKDDIAEITGPVLPVRFQIDCSPFKPGKHYLAAGYAGGRYLFRLPLIYSAFGADPDNGNGRFVGPDVVPGMSGGSLINEDHRVSGVVLQRWPARARELSGTFLCGGGDA